MLGTHQIPMSLLFLCYPNLTFVPDPRQWIMICLGLYGSLVPVFFQASLQVKVYVYQLESSMEENFT